MTEITQEKRVRSIAKSLIWRLIGVAVLALITYFFTRSLIKTTMVTFLHHFTFLFVYYFHERLWLRISWTGKKRKIGKALFYELVLGQGILGIITIVITGSLQQMSLITFTYIWNKLWIYVVYEWIWSKTSWNVKAMK